MTSRIDAPADPLVKLTGGWFKMGASDGPHLQDGEGPVRPVLIDPFQIAAGCVTNGEFTKFSRETGYQTQAEKDGKSFVFYQFLPAQSMDAPQATQAPWWRAVAGACWHSPHGQGSTIDNRTQHPVVHIAKEDAMAYCQWSGTRLPTEAEWEYAARGGLENKPFPWGDELAVNGEYRANVWQGKFPEHNRAEHSNTGTAPSKSFQPNAYGLYNTTGNVWEWTADRFTHRHSPREQYNPNGPLNGSFYVAKGGSYLCHASYCARYRNSSRQGLPADTSTGNLGFRVAL